MTKKISAISWIKDGELSIVKKDEFKKALKFAPNGRYFLSLEKSYNKRSVNQNNSVFGIAYKMMREGFIDSFGEYVTIQWVHEYCKNPDNKLIPPEYLDRIYKEYLESEKKEIINKSTGEVLTIPFKVTTTKMKTIEMMEYYSNLQYFAKDYFDMDIPDPDPEWMNKNKQNKCLK
jgi:hypothetical protein